MKLDVRLDTALADVPRAVAELEEAGVAGVFTYEGPSDPFLPLAAAAVASSLDLYTNLAIALPRSPMHLAYLAQDLQRVSAGRFSLGLGTQIRKHIVERFGSTWDSPVKQMREIILALKAIEASWVDGEPLEFVGEWTQHTYCPPLFVPPAAVKTPILVGALGPLMTKMAVEVADGILVHPFCTDRSIEEVTFSHIPDGFPVVGQSIVAVGITDEEIEQARLAARGLIAFYASTPSYRPVLEVHGWGDLQVELRDLTRAGNWAALPDAVSDEVLETIAIVGSPAQVAAGLKQRFTRCERIALSTPYAVSVPALAELASLAGE